MDDTKIVAVIGLGLIGGSIAMSVGQHEFVTVHGYDQDEQTRKVARALGAIDQECATLCACVSEADVIFLAVPVETSLELIKELEKMSLKKDVIITDVGSTKEQVMLKSDMLRKKGITFIGGHPMAGSHKSGITAAKPHLFENAYYILTPVEGEDEHAVERLKTYLSVTKAHIITLSPEEHDVMAGVISHFPHVIASSLVHFMDRYHQDFPFVKLLAAGGFRDITRIASSHPKMWSDIVWQNRDNLVTFLQEWQLQMQRLQTLIEEYDYEAVHTFFVDGRNLRESLPNREKGAIPAFYDCYIDVPDTPGAIADVATALSNEGISIVNIRIMEVREDIYGVLCVSFGQLEDRECAVEALKRKQYDVYVLS